MKLQDLVSSQERLAAMRKAIADDMPFPDCTALGSLAGPDVHQLLIHFNRDDEMNCILLEPEEVEFIGFVYNAVLDDPYYQPDSDDLLTIKALNLKLAMCSKSVIGS